MNKKALFFSLITIIVVLTALVVIREETIENLTLAKNKLEKENEILEQNWKEQVIFKRDVMFCNLTNCKIYGQEFVPKGNILSQFIDIVEQIYFKGSEYSGIIGPVVEGNWLIFKCRSNWAQMLRYNSTADLEKYNNYCNSPPP